MLNFGSSLSTFFDSLFGVINNFLNGFFAYLTAILDSVSVNFPS